MTAATALPPIPLENGQFLSAEIAWRRIGHGPVKVLLLHALTGGVFPDGPKGWWGPLFAPGAPLAADRATVDPSTVAFGRTVATPTPAAWKRPTAAA